MSVTRTYQENARTNIFDSLWGGYVNGVAPFPRQELNVAGVSATFLFYLNYQEKARETAHPYSIFYIAFLKNDRTRNH